ncbi:MAG: NHLP bacteriocin export ABC transporter permease/ATPase subunit [Acidimicrobiaceae bacterium]|nr:NHLP bacteriocin export ABC transporter permease/ATPase subunit [Acidimicrobiaceae bacterium]
MSTASRVDESVSHSLGGVARTFGEPVDVAGNRPLLLDEPASAYYVERGAVDVFFVEHARGEAVSAPKHLLRAEQGRLVFGVAPKDSPLAAVAKGLPETRVRRVPVSVFEQHAAGAELIEQVELWITEFARSVAAQIEPRPQPDMLLDPASLSEEPEFGSARVVSVRAGGIAWVQATNAPLMFLHTEDSLQGSSGLAALTADTWLTVEPAAQTRAHTSADLFESGRLFDALDDFHTLVLNAEHLNRMLLVADEVNAQLERAQHRRRDHESAREGLHALLGRARRSADPGGSELLAVLELVGEREGLEFRSPPRRAGGDHEPSLREILDASGVRARKVRLSPEERWWLGDSGTMVGFNRRDGRPVALLPGVAGRYVTVDAATGERRRLNASRAGDLAGEAWLLYPTLRSAGPVEVRDLFRLVRRGMARDVGRIIVAGLFAGLLAQAPAVVLGLLVGSVLPFAANGMLGQVVLGLGALAVVGVMLTVLQGTALMRIEGHVESRLSAALWDRLLTLPASFFRRFTAGELTVRMATFQALRDQLSGVVANASLSLIFLLPTLAILFAYDPGLALVSVALALLALVVSAILGIRQIAPLRLRFEATRRLSGDLVQFISGMNKLRVAGAEASAFASWARLYRKQHLAGIAISRRNERLAAFNAALPAVLSASLFTVLLWRGPAGTEVSDFLVVYAVSATFFVAVNGVARSIGVIAAVLVGYEQVKPILEALPEGGPEVAEPIALAGEVRFDRIGFRYADDGPPTLEDVSIHARPGEFVAVVGESGSGKSTLMRLALGLERPTVGGVYYDGRDLAKLDYRSVRRQIGMVTQDGALQPGSILDNIIGVGDELTIDDAWRAAQLADVERDISEMPMEMFTIVGESASSFSGGQIQRIRIAAALVGNPRIVLLDEATSWLDARSQAEVMRSIESLAATRIVIAHRLSTIRAADRIYVLEAGRVVQHGTFDDLYAVEGTFRTLVSRQLS